MVTPLQPRVSTHHRALSAASDTQNRDTRGVPGGWCHVGRMLVAPATLSGRLAT
jgi:hypothetical protein